MSRIPVHHSLVAARKVIKALEKIMPKDIAKNCSLESWSNSREQGLCLAYFPVDSFNTQKICIAECRNSDEILVIHGNNNGFDHQTNQPLEDTYKKNRKYFDCEHFNEVANHILNILEK